MRSHSISSVEGVKMLRKERTGAISGMGASAMFPGQSRWSRMLSAKATQFHEWRALSCSVMHSSDI